MSTEENKEIVRRYRTEYVGAGNLTAAQDLVSEELTLNGERVDLASHKQMITLWHDAFPDLHFTIEDMIAEENRVVERTTFRGTHTGDLFGIAPTGRQVEGVGILIHHIVDGKIVEIWELLDLYGLLGQLGIAPPLGEDHQ
jgi:predicted ester cyclase